MDSRILYEYALQREREGKRFYEQNAKRLGHAAAVGAFKALAAEEQRHIDFIEGLLKVAAEGQPPSGEIDTEMGKPEFFLQRALAELLGQTVLEAMVPDLPILRTAFLIERDFAEFYEHAAADAEGATRRAFEMLSHWERSHEALFKMLHDRAFEAYARMPWGG